MKRMLIILGLILVFTSLQAQSTSNYYYADGVPQYWTEDSTSVNIIVKNMQNYNAIVQNLELLFTDANDEILADDEDDNIIVNSLSLPFMHKDSIIEDKILKKRAELKAYSLKERRKIFNKQFLV